MRWLAIVVLSAIAAATLTVTASGAQTQTAKQQPNPFRVPGGGPLTPPDDAVEADADATVVTYRFEAADADEGWSAGGATEVLLDTTATWDGDRSLGIVVGGGDRRTVTLRGRLDDLARRPGFALDGAGLRCHVRLRGMPEGADVRAAAVVAGPDGTLDRGEVVTVTPDVWTTVSMVIGEHGESASGSWPALDDGEVDAGAITTIGLDVRAPRGDLPSAVNVDGCDLRAAGEVEPDVLPGGRAPLAEGDEAIGSGGADAAAPAPSRDADRGAAGGAAPRERETPEPEPAPRVPEPVTFDFESDGAVRGWTTDGTAALRVDAADSRTGRRSLRVLPTDPTTTTVTARVALPPTSPGAQPRAGAQISCQVLLPAGQGLTAPVVAGVLSQDAAGRVDVGEPTALRSGRWRTVRATVDAAAGWGGARAIAAVGVVVRGDVVPREFRIDDCTVRPVHSSTARAS